MWNHFESGIGCGGLNVKVWPPDWNVSIGKAEKKGHFQDQFGHNNTWFQNLQTGLNRTEPTEQKV